MPVMVGSQDHRQMMESPLGTDGFAVATNLYYISVDRQ